MSENARKRQGCAHWFSAALRGGLAGFLLLWTGAVRPGGAPGSARPVPTPTPTSVTPVRGQPVCVTPVTDLGPYPDQPVALTGVAAFGPRDAWAAGYVVHGIAGTIYGARFPLIEHWNGVRWVTLKLPSAPGKGLMSLAAVSAHDMWAVGNNVAWHWDGRTWCDETASINLFTLPHPGRAFPEAKASVAVSPRGTVFVAAETTDRVPRDVLDVVYRSRSGWRSMSPTVGAGMYGLGGGKFQGLLLAERYPV
ncbi:MAG: hypothetical protein M3Y74_11380, partial [Chloroflexota bacterium]|nr:hypothetical protein [Chloroflexota bacterium]